VYTELPGLGHFLLMEDPEAVARPVRRFIDTV
jgi:pimeloyl-ACP methyl ester carboxylesterase